MLTIGDIIEGKIVGLAFGGEGILRHLGFVVFIPFAAPGDFLKVKITQRKSSFAKGEIVQVLEKSPIRTNPPCPYFGICGGCQMQHIDYNAQLEYKKQILSDTLQRIGHLEPPAIPPIRASQLRWAYRRHITLKMQPCDKAYQAVYTGADNQTLLAVAQCPIFLPREDHLLLQLQLIASALKSSPANEGKVSILKQSETRFLFHFQFRDMPPNFIEVVQGSLQGHPEWSVIIDTKTGSWSCGIPETSIAVEGLNILAAPQAFIQNHPEQSLNIYRKILEIAHNAKVKSAVDLYCGIGISSLLLGREGISVTGVEYNHTAIELAKVNAKNNRIGNVRFLQGAVERVLAGILTKTRPDLVIVNPPRQGLTSQVMKILLKHLPSQLIYISCMPATLARDLQLLCVKNYKIIGCEGFDMFPQTTHLETVAYLKQQTLN